MRSPASERSIVAPASSSFVNSSSRCSGCAFVTVTSPSVATAAAAHVPTSIRSGTAVCSAPCSGPSTPSISIVLVPAPSTRAPIAVRNAARSATSGSRAALSITVVPVASTAASNRFSVAVTLG